MSKFEGFDLARFEDEPASSISCSSSSFKSSSMSQVGLDSRRVRWAELGDTVGRLLPPSLGGLWVGAICGRFGRWSSVSLVVASFLKGFLKAFSMFLTLI